jgi:hypothetical protein
MLTRIVINDSEIQSSLDDTPTARGFAALLPLSLTLADFHGTERIADLPRRLTTTDAPPGTQPRAGDVTYYAPCGNLALCYRDFTYSDGLIRLGRLDTGAANVLAGFGPGHSLARIELATGGVPTGR